MKKNLSIAVIPALGLALVLIAVTSTFAASGTSVVAGPAGANQNDPLAWTGLLPVSLNPWYDNTSSIAASPLDAAITIGWEERDEGEAHSFGAIMQASNTGVGLPLNNQEVDRTAWKESGNVEVRADSLGRRHMVHFAYSGGGTCGVYAQIGTNGLITLVETIPNSCSNFSKHTALAVGPDNTVHVVLGRDNLNLYYFQRNPAGAWVVQNELIYAEVNTNDPTAPAMAVSTGGQVIAAWLQRPNGGGKYDIIAGKRTSPGVWVYENVSAACCTGCSFDSNTYHPALAADRVGGIRLAWIEEQCNPRTDPRSTDTYYRQWVPGTGWDNQPLVLVDGSGGQQYYPGIAVDNSGMAHIGYGSDNSRGRDNYTLAMVSGSGTVFSAVERPFFSNGAFMKEPGVAHGPGYVFASFNSNFNAPQFKTIYYAYKDIPDSGATPTPTATNTPLPAPPRCPGQRFTDVCPGDFFYTPVLGLVDRNIMSGYNTVPPCAASNHIPCFKPENNITRGQIAKVIALGARLPYNLEGAPHFQDVPPTHTFYEEIEISYNAGVISGYPCGGVNEPCIPPGNLPYYRPGNNVTRGQLSQMVSRAFGYNEPVTGQTFQDVPANHTFYLPIERLAGRGIIGGYACGGPGEPCVPPQNRPYFRPNNNVTRGQAAKIIYDAVVDLEQQPTATATLEATATVDATATILVTVTPEVTITPEITLTPDITATPEITATPTEMATATGTLVVRR
jgi:hypothetical protein